MTRRGWKNLEEHGLIGVSGRAQKRKKPGNEYYMEMRIECENRKKKKAITITLLQRIQP